MQGSFGIFYEIEILNANIFLVKKNDFIYFLIYENNLCNYFFYSPTFLKDQNAHCQGLIA